MTLKLIKKLDPNKVHGHDVMSITMIKIWDASICKSLELIFRSCIENVKFPTESKKAIVILTHKKADEQNLKKYRPISLLPVARKIFERTLWNKIDEFFTGINLISPNQSGFKPSDSCINQLLPITHEIYKSFDDGLEVQGIFLDNSKAFDKAWHKELLYKFKQNGISGKLFDIITDFLNFKKQRIVLNRQYYSWTSIEVGVSQRFILEPLLLLIYINDFSDNLTANVKLLADETFHFPIVHNTNTSTINLNKDLNKIKNWAIQWEMSFNADPSKQAQEITFSKKLQKTNHNQVYFNQNSVQQIPSQKRLGMYLNTKLNLQEQLTY